MYESKQNYWYLIPAELVEEGKFGKALLYGLIWSLTNKKGYCWASNKYLAKKLNRKDESIIRTYLTELEKENWLKMEYRNSKKRKIYPLVNPHQRVEKPTCLFESVEKSNTTRGKNPVQRVEKSTQSNIKSIYKEYNNIYDYWNSLKLKQNKEMTEDKEKSIKNALKEYTQERIKIAMKNYAIVIKDKSYFYEYEWSMEKFLNRKQGIKEFMPDGEKWLNYINWKSKQTKTDPNEIARKKRLASEQAQKRIDEEHKIQAEKVNEFHKNTGGKLNLTEKIKR